MFGLLRRPALACAQPLGSRRHHARARCAWASSLALAALAGGGGTSTAAAAGMGRGADPARHPGRLTTPPYQRMHGGQLLAPPPASAGGQGGRGKPARCHQRRAGRQRCERPWRTCTLLHAPPLLPAVFAAERRGQHSCRNNCRTRWRWAMTAATLTCQLKLGPDSHPNKCGWARLRLSVRHGFD